MAVEVWRFRPKMVLIPDWAVSTLLGLGAVTSVFIKLQREAVLGVCGKVEVDQMVCSKKVVYGHTLHSAPPGSAPPLLPSP
jgi:hypothetical protein